MKCIVIGLGNPGKKYEHTRHNAGFHAVDELSRRLGIAVTQEKHQALIGKGKADSQDIILAKPQTYMNESGRSVAALVRDNYLSAADIIVLHDELDLAPGIVRIKAGGGHGGHNGLRSIIVHLGTAEFTRVRIGIGRPEPGRDAADYVLGPFSGDERQTMKVAVEKAADAVIAILSQDIGRAMNQFNQK